MENEQIQVPVETNTSENTESNVEENQQIEPSINEEALTNELEGKTESEEQKEEEQKEEEQKEEEKTDEDKEWVKNADTNIDESLKEIEYFDKEGQSAFLKNIAKNLTERGIANNAIKEVVKMGIESVRADAESISKNKGYQGNISKANDIIKQAPEGNRIAGLIKANLGNEDALNTLLSLVSSSKKGSMRVPQNKGSLVSNKSIEFKQPEVKSPEDALQDSYNNARKLLNGDSE